MKPQDRIIAYDCAAYSQESPGNEENCIAMGSPQFDGNSTKDTMLLKFTWSVNLSVRTFDSELFLRLSKQ
ncbi:hypothetical protein Trydic_g10330 [Trypoxylus dichotomus]